MAIQKCWIAFLANQKKLNGKISEKKRPTLTKCKKVKDIFYYIFIFFIWMAVTYLLKGEYIIIEEFVSNIWVWEVSHYCGNIVVEW